jgi:tyrosyl-tRNA synthetase
LLVGLDGVNKMSKSLDNYVGITEAPSEMFGKIMSLPDRLMPSYFALTTGWSPSEVETTLASIDAGDIKPVDAKRLLARSIIDLYHGDGAGDTAQQEFDRVFRAHEKPTDIPERVIAATEFVDDGGIRFARALALAGLVSSNKDGRRMIEQGAVRCNDERVNDPDAVCTVDTLDGATLQVGRRQWALIRVDNT